MLDDDPKQVVVGLDKDGELIFITGKPAKIFYSVEKLAAYLKVPVSEEAKRMQYPVKFTDDTGTDKVEKIVYSQDGEIDPDDIEELRVKQIVRVVTGETDESVIENFVNSFPIAVGQTSVLAIKDAFTAFKSKKQ